MPFAARWCLFLIAMLGSSGRAAGQMISSYNLSRSNGLPSNLVYSAAVDHLGYLWLGTNRGVARYNGYDLNVYNVSNGLLSNDVWGFYLDRRNRLWLRTKASGVGYMANGTYHTAYLHDIKQPLLYPRLMSEYEGGIFFFTDNMRPGTTVRTQRILCQERNDTLRFTTHTTPNGYELHGDKLAVWNNFDIRLYRMAPDGHLIPGTYCTQVAPQEIPGKGWTFLHNYLVTFWTGKPGLKVVDLRNCQQQQLEFDDAQGQPDPIHFVDFFRNRFYILGDAGVHVLDSVLRPTAYLDYRSLSPQPELLRGEQTANCIIDDFWGVCISTRNHGFFVRYGTERGIRRLPADLAGFDFLGTTSDTLSFWWNRDAEMLALVAPDGKARFRPWRVPAIPSKLIPFTANASLVLTNSGQYILPHEEGDVLPARYVDEQTWLDSRYGKDLVATERGTLLANNKGLHLYRESGGVLRSTELHPDRFYHLGTAPTRHLSWASNDDAILVYRHTDGRRCLFPVVPDWGLHGIEDVFLHEPTGTVLIQDFNRLLQLDRATGRLKTLFGNYNFQDAQVLLRGDLLIAAGSFGILFSHISTAGVFTAPVVYPNIKHSLYHSLEGMAVLKGSVLLQTDDGLRQVDIPDASLLARPHRPGRARGRLVVESDGRLHPVQPTDTIPVSPARRLLRLDAINPTGAGPVTYRYRLSEGDTAWRALPGRELQLPELSPERYHTLSIIAADQNWVSEPAAITLYQLPSWWQTATARFGLAGGGFVLLAGLLLLAVLLTRNFMAKATRKRQWRTTLELRAIHSQINPHFIFNTLNSSLYFIRKNRMADAATHITRFSHLLRSYLDSSRNRYLPLEDEVANLRNYIELQQTRFDHRFDYTIDVDERLLGQGLLLPSLLLQPLVENAINHGLVPLPGREGHLAVRFTLQPGGGLRLAVDDNGVGRRQARQTGSGEVLKRESYGNQLIRELIDILNRHEKLGVQLLYTDKLPPASGTTVVITIKNPRYAS